MVDTAKPRFDISRHDRTVEVSRVVYYMAFFKISFHFVNENKW